MITGSGECMAGHREAESQRGSVWSRREGVGSKAGERRGRGVRSQRAWRARLRCLDFILSAMKSR